MIERCFSPESEMRVDEPVWEPLLEAVGERLTSQFMWMYASDMGDGIIVHAYKHSETRCYLFLDEEGHAFEWTACERYAPTRLDFAIQNALCNWWILKGWEEEDREAILAAVLKAQESMRESA